MNRPIAFLLTVLVGSVPVVTAPNHVVAGSEVTVETVLSAWKARQERVRSARFVWREQQTQPKGSNLNPSFGKAMNPKGLFMPPEDVTHNIPMSFAFDGDKMRVTYETQDWLPAKSQYVTQGYTSVFDGNVSKLFHPPGDVDWPVGIIRKQKKHEDITNVHIRPILATYRPFHPDITFLNANSLTLSNESATVQGRRCLLLKDERPSGETNSFWVDSDRDFSILRYVLTYETKVVLQLDIEYSKHQEHGWVPAKWKLIWMKPDGSLHLSSAASVNKWEINVPIEKEEFQLTFPAGTRVVDETAEEDKKDYIVREGGSKRIIFPEEIGATYDQLLKTEPGEAFGKLPYSKGWIWAVGFGILIFFLVLLVWRKAKRET